MTKYPRVWGIGRDAENEKSLAVFFDRRPTDDEMRSFHDLIRRTQPDGFEAAALAGEPAHAAAIKQMLPQLLIVLLTKLGGAAIVSVDEIDGTGGRVVTMQLVGRTFHFKVGRKQ